VIGDVHLGVVRFFLILQQNARLKARAFVLAESIIDGKPYRPNRTDWKDHRNEEIVGNCSGCGTPQLIDTFKILCPASFAAYFDGYTPY
jgi:hypothetical protein